MKAMLVDENKDLVWLEVSNPVMKEDEVLVKIYAAALFVKIVGGENGKNINTSNTCIGRSR